MKRKLPIEINDFKELIENNYYYVDKTLVIETILKNQEYAMWITRPRRFGKTLFISMLENFFDIEKKEENKDLFKNLKIYKSEYYRYFGSYPVIKLNFKSLKQDNYEVMYRNFKEMIRQEYESKRYLLNILTDEEKEIFLGFTSETASIEKYQQSIKILSNFLYRYYKKKVIILIDEYDVPIQQGYLYNFYNDIVTFIREVFSNGIKDNEYLELSVITGVLRISKESLFSDLNNVKVYSILGKEYNEYFGFTESETKELLEYYGLSLTSEVKDMYDGYNFNGTYIYNPWSILNYANDKELVPYWVNTSGNELIMDAMEQVVDEVKVLIESLIGGASIPFTYDEKVTYIDISTINSITGIINFFLQSGYLTIDSKYGFNINNLYAKIPNNEIRSCFALILNRLIDKKIEDYLSVFGAISIEGPKWCGKTWTSLNHANSVVYLDDEEVREKANLSLDYILNDERPELIDEWNLVPKTWDAVRRKCDDTLLKGNYILTCSTKLSDDLQKECVHHSGAGRIGKIKMHTMSLYESGDSSGVASITDMLNDKQKNIKIHLTSLENIANLIIRGGWPSNINTQVDKLGIIPKGYIDTILDSDMNDNKKRDKNRMYMLLKSLARNESTVVSNQTLLNDIEEFSNDTIIESRITLKDYLDVLNRLHITENQNAYSENYRSPSRVGKSPKRHFVDPSLACACLELTKEKLIDDLRTFGFMFESLVERDLKVYMEYLNGNLYHFRDNVTGLEVDSILEFPGGDYAAVEIKLGFNGVEDAKKNLLSLYDNMNKKPKFMCIIVGYHDFVVKDQETGIYIVPITALRP